MQVALTWKDGVNYSIPPRVEIMVRRKFRKLLKIVIFRANDIHLICPNSSIWLCNWMVIGLLGEFEGSPIVRAKDPAS